LLIYAISTEQWIHSWFGRERQKKFGSKKTVTTLKAEDEDPLPPDNSSSNAISDIEVTDNISTQSSSGPPKKKARTSRTNQTLSVKKENLETVFSPLEPDTVTVASGTTALDDSRSAKSTDQAHMPASVPSKPLKQAGRRQRKEPAASLATAFDNDMVSTAAIDYSFQTPPPIVVQVRNRSCLQLGQWPI